MPSANPDSYPGTPGTPLYAGRVTPGAPPSFAVANELRISSVSGTETNYPYQFGRPFRLGEIANFPQVLIDGTPVTTQADVKTRHTDGSVKFAVISIVVPSLPTSETVLTFQNQASVVSTPETIANMLASYDFEATINVAVAGTPVAGAPVSARAMLTALSDAGLAAETAAAGVNARYWTQGPICTTVLLHDHTTKVWDIGTNATKAIRPMFIVQFWPTVGKYHVRHIIEGGDVTKLKDEVGIDVTFTTGQAAPITRLTQASAYLYGATFQSRAYWGGTQVARCNAKHGVAYLSDTRAMPNYDSSIVMNTTAIASYASDWAGRSKALGANGYWEKGMDATGGRQDLGLMPKWDCVALYSGAAHMHQIGETMAEMAGSWAFFFREGSASKVIFGLTPGRGRVISKVSRPTQFMYDNNNNMVTSGDNGFTVDGSLAARSGWTHDSAHTPGMFWFQYLTTGSAFWHEKLIQLGAWGQFLTNPGLSYNGVGNGRASTDMILNGVQPRGWGWQMRNRARAWWAALDGSPERDLMEKALLDPIAQKAGQFDVAGLLVGNPVRDAWNANYAEHYSGSGTIARPNALHYWEPKGGYSEAQFIGSMGSIPDDWGGGAQASWMRNYITMCIYHVIELGFTQATLLADWVAYQTIETAIGPEPNHIGDYVTPDVKVGSGYYQTLDDMYDGWANTGNLTLQSGGFPAGGGINTYTVTLELYGSIASTAVAMSNGAPNQSAAWAFIGPIHTSTLYHNHDPRYAVIPRA